LEPVAKNFDRIRGLCGHPENDPTEVEALVYPFFRDPDIFWETVKNWQEIRDENREVFIEIRDLWKDVKMDGVFMSVWGAFAFSALYLHNWLPRL